MKETSGCVRGGGARGSVRSAMGRGSGDRSARRALPRPWVAALVACLLAAGCGSGPDHPERIVLVVIDTLRDDYVGGTAPPTPSLDALAARGQRLTGAVSSWHQTTMSMGSLFSGRTPSLEHRGQGRVWSPDTWCGLARFQRRPDSGCIPDEVKTLAGTLAEAGYHSVGVTSNPLLFEPAGYSKGFARWIEVGSSSSEPGERIRAGDAAYHWRDRSWPRVRAALERVLAETPHERVFLYVHLMEAHDYLRCR